MSALFKSAMEAVNRVLRNGARSRLRPTGLYYDDAIVITPDVQKALQRLPAEVKVERLRRIKRAMDLTAKKKELPKEMQNYDPFDVIYMYFSSFFTFDYSVFFRIIWVRLSSK